MRLFEDLLVTRKSYESAPTESLRWAIEEAADLPHKKADNHH